MNTISVEIIIIGLLIIANGVFAMSEIAVVSARKVRLQQRAEEGDKGARLALGLANAPNRFLSTVQIGITLIGILAGAFGGATIAQYLAASLKDVPLLAPYSEAVALTIVVMIIGYFSLVIGELVPKRLALNSPERIASALAPLMHLLSKITSPIVHLLSISSEAVLRILGMQKPSEPPITEQDIRLLMDQATHGGIFNPTEREIVDQVFRLDDRQAHTLMTPRLDIIWLDANDPIDEIMQTITASPHSRFPLADGDLDHVLGVVHTKDLLAQCFADQTIDVKAALQPAVFIVETASALEVLNRFKETHSQLGLVLDEHSGVQGLVTLGDIFEAIVGELPAEGETEPEFTQLEDGSWLLDGGLSIDEVKEILHIANLPDDEKGYYQTLAGFVMAILGRIPAVGDSFEAIGLRFEVAGMERLRIEKVLIKPIDRPAAQDE